MHTYFNFVRNSYLSVSINRRINHKTMISLSAFVMRSNYNALNGGSVVRDFCIERSEKPLRYYGGPYRKESQY